MDNELPTVDEDLELAGELVREAGRLAARMLADGLDTQHKSSVSDVVSAADHAAEELIAGRLAELRPADGLVGEEGAHRPGRRTWFIDPVDGTYNFLAGLPFWCSAAALTDQPADSVGDRQPGLGAVYFPQADELWLAAPGRPTTCNGRPLTPLTDAPLARLSLASYLHPPRLADPGIREPTLALIGGAATVRMLGSGSVELAQLASGRLGAWVQVDCPEWDWLPGAALVRSVGGSTEVLRHRGHRWHLAGNRQALADIRRLITGEPEDLVP
ncbi:MAG TPA: inositol monophosphatase family protein [Jatrophihabitans sp.]|nr:inositol monophosphatase family protein [Jatrophihabitans sp.]